MGDVKTVDARAGNAPDDGLPVDGLPVDGLPDDGLPDDGLPDDGLPDDGTPVDGTPVDGTPVDGTPVDGDGTRVDKAPPPSLARQKTYIVENGDILNLATRKSILRIVLMDIGKSAADEQFVIIKNQASADVSLNLDKIDNPDVVLHIFNIVSNRRASLNEPANISGW